MAFMGLDFDVPLTATGAVNDLLAMRAAGARNALEATRPIAREIYMVRKRKGCVSTPAQQANLFG